MTTWILGGAARRATVRAGGRLIAGVNDPCTDEPAHPDSDYSATYEFSGARTFSGQGAALTYWHRPLHAMTGAFIEAGVRIAVPSGAFLCFLFLALEAA